jgi:L-2-hydroxyglutarate oxidase LhgO
MEKLDCVVIGAGVVGLAIARELAMAGREVMVLEAEDAIGTHTSSRNSEVIHAGISYEQDSLKGGLCVAGKDMLYRYCKERGVDHQPLGKLIVAVEDGEAGDLMKYKTRAEANGVHDLREISRAELAELEPQLKCRHALLSPSTGIVDVHGLMLAYLGDAQAHGAELALKSPVISGDARPDGIVLRLGGDEEIEVHCSTVINAAGLWAHDIASRISGIRQEAIPEIHYAIGHYYSLSGPAPFTRLVYPVARESWKRVHVTVDLAGQCKFGPDLRWRDTVDYRFDESHAADFYNGVRRYYPGLKDGALTPGYTGIRPRLSGPNEQLRASNGDFLFQTSAEHGVDGLINLLGIESPGLTSSMAIGAHVARLL